MFTGTVELLCYLQEIIALHIVPLVVCGYVFVYEKSSLISFKHTHKLPYINAKFIPLTMAFPFKSSRNYLLENCNNFI